MKEDVKLVTPPPSTTAQIIETKPEPKEEEIFEGGDCQVYFISLIFII